MNNKFKHYLNLVRENSSSKSFDKSTLDKHVLAFMVKYGAKYYDNDGSILEYLQNNDEDHSDEQSQKELKAALKAAFTTNELRHVTVEYSDGSKIDTSINGTDDEIRDYFKIGKKFNLGNAPVKGDGNYGDNIQTVVGVTINESGSPYDLYSSTTNHKGIREGDRVYVILGPYAGKDKFYGIVDKALPTELFITFYGMGGNKVSGSTQMVYDYVHPAPVEVANEALTKADLINILGKYTTYLFDNNYINTIFSKDNTDKIVAEFMGISESMVNESYNIMTVTVPGTRMWFNVTDDRDGKKYKAFKFMDKTWVMRDKDVAMFTDNVKQNIKFRYMKNAKPLFMEFPEPAEARGLGALKPTVHYTYTLESEPDKQLHGSASICFTEESIRKSIESFTGHRVKTFKFQD